MLIIKTGVTPTRTAGPTKSAWEFPEANPSYFFLNNFISFHFSSFSIFETIEIFIFNNDNTYLLTQLLNFKGFISFFSLFLSVHIGKIMRGSRIFGSRPCPTPPSHAKIQKTSFFVNTAAILAPIVFKPLPIVLELNSTQDRKNKT